MQAGTVSVAENKHITEVERSLMDTIRGYRNMVHLDNNEDSYVSRADMMDTRKALDIIVQRFSYPPVSAETS